MEHKSSVARTGVIGLGAMGLQMARHMVCKGFEVSGYDVDSEAAKKAASHGVRVCGSVAEVGTAVYVIGNAPTALLALCMCVQQGLVTPALVVAMPVGFVSVVESKEQALALACPVITVRGRKGGSAVAAATVNALLLMTQREKQA